MCFPVIESDLLSLEPLLDRLTSTSNPLVTEDLRLPGPGVDGRLRAFIAINEVMCGDTDTAPWVSAAGCEGWALSSAAGLDSHEIGYNSFVVSVADSCVVESVEGAEYEARDQANLSGSRPGLYSPEVVEATGESDAGLVDAWFSNAEADSDCFCEFITSWSDAGVWELFHENIGT